MESGKIIVVANQKGGVAKTSTVRNLSYALAEMGKKVLVVDFDPQYNLTTSFGVLPTQAPYNTGTLITNLLLDESLPDTNEFIQKIGSVDLIPSSRSLTVAEANLLMTPDSNDYLAALLNPLRLSYDYIIVDTNPSLGSLTINALTAADEVIIPIDPELFALTGLQALVDTIQKIKRKLNPSIEIGGILFTKCNKRTNLYRRTYPDADISIMGYEATKFEDNSFDVILGNIPFNSVKIYDRRYNDLNPYIHDYFFIKSLDLAKPGGIIAFITSKGIMDRKDESLREYIARRAEFIGAIRLPNTAFKALAGTDVTADVVFLKKRVQPIELDRANLPSWIETDLDRSKWIAYNRYFKDNPEMLMGEMVSSRNMYGNEDGTACVAPEDFDLNQHLTQAVDSLYARFTAEPDEEIEADEPEESNTE